MIDGHGGNIYQLARDLGCNPADIMDMSSNVNPLGPPPGLIDDLKSRMEILTALPEADAEAAVLAFAARHGTEPERVLAGNGTTQFIHAIPQALESRRVLILGPTYADYADACRMHNVPFTFFMTEPASGFAPDMDHLAEAVSTADTVFICNPNNPTGQIIPSPDLRALCQAYPDVRFVVDESYLPFVEDADERSMIGYPMENVIVLHSMSKIFRVPGLRIGFVVSSGRLIRRLARYALPWSVNSLAQAAVVHLMTRRETVAPFVRESRAFLATERRRMMAHLSTSDLLRPFPSCTSFLLIQLGGVLRSETVCAALARERLLIRNCVNFEGLSDRFIRVSLKTAEVNRIAAERLAALG